MNSLPEANSARQGKLARLAAGAAVVAVLAGGGAAVWAATGDSPDSTLPAIDATTLDDNSDAVVLTAADGAVARAERAQFVPASPPPIAVAATESTEPYPTDGPYPVDCGYGGEPYVPTAEELAEVNADSNALAAVLTRYGIDHTFVVDDIGYGYVEYDFDDVVTQSVVDSFWEQRYPIEPSEPISVEELDRLQAENDLIAAALDAAGIAYTRVTDESGFEYLEWDYENADAQAAVDAVYAELYPPTPPTSEDLEFMNAENDRLATAFDAAGIAYTIVSDDAGWSWVEWDYDDESLIDAVAAVFDELYPVEPLGELPIAPPIDDCEIDIEPGIIDEPYEEGTLSDDVALEPSEAGQEYDEAVESPIFDPIDQFTPEQIAQRDADVAALSSGFDAAGVAARTVGESPWQSVIFDLDADAAVQVVADVLAARG